MAFGSRKRAARPADGSMSLMEHLYELRRRLFFAVLGLLAGTVVGFIWFSVAIPALHIRSLGDLLIAPYCQVPADRRVTFNGECRLMATGPFSVLQIRLKAAMMAGAVLSSPVWLAQLWGFVTPALYAKEKRFARIFVGSAAVLMVAGALLAYWVIHEGLTVLLGFGGDIATSALSPDAYYGFLIGVLLIFGVSFLLPLLLIMLNLIGVVSAAKLAKVRRYAFFGLVVFAGLTVPGNDPLTMGALAIALCILYEIAVQVSRIHDKRKAKRLAAQGFGDLADDQASPLVTDSAALAAAQPPAASPVPAAEPVPTAEPVPATGLVPAPAAGASVVCGADAPSSDAASGGLAGAAASPAAPPSGRVLFDPDAT